MKHPEQWAPTKFVMGRKTWVATRDPAFLSRGSRLIGGMQAELYSTLLRQHARGRLLDVGCGKVPLYGMYREHVSETICLDWPSSLHETPHLDVSWDLTQPWPFSADEFDTVLATDVLEHLPNPELFWTECARILRPMGKLILGVPFLYWLHEQPHDYHRFTEFALRRCARENGLQVKYLEPYGSALHVIFDVCGKLLSRSRILFATQSIASRVILNTFGIGHIVNQTAPIFPLGYGLVCEKERSD
ncbi:MAG: class I SAM-dependent methyltransferase [Planctomycetota bacterium]